MKLRHWIIGIVLVLLVASAIVGLVLKQNVGQPSGIQTSARARGKKVARATDLPSPETLVDVAPLQTARRVAALAACSDEQSLSDQAQKIADHADQLACYDPIG